MENLMTPSLKDKQNTILSRLGITTPIVYMNITNRIIDGKWKTIAEMGISGQVINLYYSNSPFIKTISLDNLLNNKKMFSKNGLSYLEKIKELMRLSNYTPTQRDTQTVLNNSEYIHAAIEFLQLAIKLKQNPIHLYNELIEVVKLNVPLEEQAFLRMD
jgi:hypothetical protein